MPARRFRTPPLEVDALQWLGPENCREVHEFSRLPHPENSECSELHLLGALVTVHPGDWLVRYPSGALAAMSERQFAGQFEPVPDDVATPTP